MKFSKSIYIKASTTQLIFKLCLILILSMACKGLDKKTPLTEEHTTSPSINSQQDPCTAAIHHQIHYKDTLYARTTAELMQALQSNRLIHLADTSYIFEHTLKCEKLEQLKIVGSANTTLAVKEKNATVLRLLNVKDIVLDKLTIGHRQSSAFAGQPAALRIQASRNIHITNTKILGAGTFGLLTINACHLNFENIVISDCSATIFELDNSKHITFKDAVFHNNDLDVSVLGGFTNASSAIYFQGCSFLNNQPKIGGNPAFNFMNNYNDFEQKVIFKNCTFKNNKGFKWYGEKIELIDCVVDTSDFIGFE